MFNKIVLLHLLIYSTVYSQGVGTSLPKPDYSEIQNSVVEIKKNKSSSDFIAHAISVGLESSVIDSLLYFKQKYVLINKNISKNSKQRDSLFLFSRNSGTKKRENFNNYRKEISNILSQEQFYNLYQNVIDPEIESEITRDLEQIKNNYNVNTQEAKTLKGFLDIIAKQKCIIDEYYIYNKKLVSLKRIEIDQLAESKIQAKIEDLELQPKSKYINYFDPSIVAFVKKAKAVGIEEERIVLLANGITKLKKGLKKSSTVNNVIDSNQLYTLDDESYHSSNIHSQIAKHIASIISIEEYRNLFLDQLASKIEILSQLTFQELNDKYQPVIPKKQEEVLLKWIKTVTEKELVTSNYYQYNKDLKRIKIRAIQLESENEYHEILNRISKKPIDFITHMKPIEQHFLMNAEKQGVDMDKAHEVLRACLNYESKQKELDAQTKYEKEHVYYLDLNDNTKSGLRDSFKRYLSKKINQDEYGKLFWDQLKPVMERKTDYRLKKAHEVYNFNEGAKTELKKMLFTQVKKEVVAYQYYSYDKKIARQKLKALQFKFETDYKEKIKELK